MKLNFRKRSKNRFFEGFKKRSVNLAFSQNRLVDKNNILKITEHFFATEDNKVLLVSANGKKSVGVNFAKNLGGASSSLGKKTLLIDCDFSDYGLTKSLQFSKSSMGLTNVLSDPEAALNAINTVNPQLQVLTVGSVIDENQFILKFQNFKKLINIYRDYYDFIVIISTENRDSFLSEIMYQSTDQVVLVTPTNVERKCDLRAFKRTVTDQDSEFMGVVFND